MRHRGYKSTRDYAFCLICVWRDRSLSGSGRLLSASALIAALLYSYELCSFFEEVGFLWGMHMNFEWFFYSSFPEFRNHLGRLELRDY